MGGNQLPIHRSWHGVQVQICVQVLETTKFCESGVSYDIAIGMVKICEKLKHCA